ncbi:replication-relaxation family protein [Streptomyces sp. NPDC055254]
MASTAEPEQTPEQAPKTPSVDPSITPSAPRSGEWGVSAGQTGRARGRRRSDNPHVPRRPKHRRTSTGPRRRELLQALGIFQRATPDQLWKLTRPENRHDKLTRDNLLDLEDHHLVRIESVQEDQRQVWVLTKRGHGEAKQLLEPKGIRVSVLREEKYDPDTGELLGTGYDDHAAAVTSTAAELHRAGIGHRIGFQTEIGHRLGNSFVQRADLVVRAPAAGVPVLLLEIDRRTEDAHELVQKLHRYWEWGRLLPPDADERTVDLVRSRPDAIDTVDHEERLWRRVYPPTGREGLPPVAFVFADTTEAKVDNTVAVLEEAGRRYWAPRRYESYHRGITALDYGQAVPVVVTTLEQLQEHGADGEVWRRLGRTGEQTLTAALDNPDGDALYRAQAARADERAARRRAAEREAQRPVCSRCGQKFIDDRWEETTARGGAWTAGDLTVCGTCHADDVAREQAARLQAAVQPPLEDDREPARPGRGLFRRRG